MAVHSELRTYFQDCPKTRLSFSMRSGEPVKAVAVGAAYYGQSLMSSFGDAVVKKEKIRIKNNSLAKLSSCIMTDIASRSIMLKVKRRAGAKHLFFTLIRKGEFLPYRHCHIFHPRSRGQQTIFLEIYDCSASFDSRYVSIDNDSSEIQKIGEFKFSLQDKKHRNKKSKPRNGSQTANQSPLVMGSGNHSSLNSTEMDSRKLDICVSFFDGSV